MYDIQSSWSFSGASALRKLLESREAIVRAFEIHNNRNKQYKPVSVEIMADKMAMAMEDLSQKIDESLGLGPNKIK